MSEKKGSFWKEIRSFRFGKEPPPEDGWRYEWKFAVSPGDLIQIRARLRQVADLDAHAAKSGGTYRVRSLYFDDPYDTAVLEKVDGLNPRGKFRLRMYNARPDLIRLERKYRDGTRGIKFGVSLTPDDADALLQNRPDWLERKIQGFPEVQGVKTPQTPVDEMMLALYYQMRLRVLRPRQVVEYEREPYVYAPGNVRVTFDSDLRKSGNPADFLRPELRLPIPAADAPLLMEVKWDAFLPTVIQEAICFSGQLSGAFSKYVHCRLCD